MHHFSARTALCLALLAGSPLAFAASPQASSAGAEAGQHARHGQHEGMRGTGHQMGLIQQLDLTDAQRTSIRQMMRDSFQQARPQMMALRQQRLAFDNATPGTSDYQTLANNLAQAESTAAHNEILRQAALRTKMYNVLTPAQRTKLASLVAERRQQMEQRRARMQQQRSGAPASSSK